MKEVVTDSPEVVGMGLSAAAGAAASGSVLSGVVTGESNGSVAPGARAAAGCDAAADKLLEHERLIGWV